MNSEVLSLVLRARDETAGVVGKLGKDVTGLTGKLKDVGKGMVLGAGMAAFNLLSGAVETAIGKLGEAHQAYLDDQAGQTLLTQSLKNNIPAWDGSTASVEAYSAAQGRLGFTNADVRTSIGQLVGVTHDLSDAQTLNSLAEELARAKGIDLATATDIVTKAHEGNGRALKALGIDIGGAKTGAELLDAIQKNVKGSAESWATTNTGKLAVSNVKVEEAMVKVGAVIDKVSQVAIPILADAFTTIVDVLGKVWDAVQPVVATISKALQPAFKTLGDVIGNVWDFIVAASRTAAGIVNGILDGIRAAIKIVSDAIDAVMGKGGTPEQRAEYERTHGPGGLPGTAGPGKPKNVGGGLMPGAGGFAAGGFIPPGIWGMTGEQGPEPVFGGRTGATILPNGAMGANINFGAGAIIVQGASDPEATARSVMLAIKRELGRQGMSFSTGLG